MKGLNYIRTTLLLGLSSLAVFSNAQQCEVTLRILDQEGLEMVGAYVEVTPSALKAVTDIKGEVTFTLNQSQNYSFTVRSVGLETITSNLQVPGNQSYRHSIQMKESATELGEVIVSGKTASQEAMEQPYKVEFMGLDNIRSQPVELVSIINQMPGMRLRQNGGVGSEVDVSINGIGGKGVAIFVDEIPVHLLGAGYALNTISQGIIENIEIYKGTIPVRFGSDALGGVINITTRQKNSDYLDLSYSYGSWNTHQSSIGINKRFGRSRKFVVGVEGFQTYSDNNYWMDDVLIVDQATSQPGSINTKRGRARRFNDSFDSKLARVTLGVRDLVWADEIQLFSTFSNVQREWQHGITAENPWGDTFSDETSWSTAFTWKKYSKNDRWDISLASGIIKNNLTFTDTTSRIYRWDATFEPRPNGLQGESGIFSRGTTPDVSTDSYFIRQSSNFEINKRNSLNLTSFYTLDALLAENKAFTEEDQESIDEPQDLIKNYLGLSLESKFLGDKITNTIYAKHFYQRSAAISFDFGEVGPLEKNTYSVFGYGDVIRYSINTNFVANLGFESTARQPDGEELFGDFIRIIPNPELRPEQSQNINAGIEWKTFQQKMTVAGAFFYRNTSDKIFLVAVADRDAQYENLSQVETTGFEFTTQYRLSEDLNFMLNSTYFNAKAIELNTERGFSANSIGKRIPNEPYFFSNFMTNYSLQNPFSGKGELKVTYSFNYVHPFLVSWDQKATGQATTPSQKIHNLSLVWNAPKEKWSLGLECRNLLNALAFDNFQVQRPGRSIYAKARIFLEKL